MAELGRQGRREVLEVFSKKNMFNKTYCVYYNQPYGVDSIIICTSQTGKPMHVDVKKFTQEVQYGCPCLRVIACTMASQALLGQESHDPK